MEILNNIWYALTTENELLLNLLCLPIFGVEAFLMLKLFTSIIKLEYTKEQQNIFIALFTSTLKNLNSLSKYTSVLMKIFGIILICAGLYIDYRIFSAII